LLLEGGTRIRLLGVDTPETKIPDQPPEPWGPEASDFTARKVTGKQVRLEFDRERFDQYGRTLAYVYVGDLFLNEELIRQGLSTAQLQYPYRSDMKRRFLNAEQEARAQRRGIWSSPEAKSRSTEN
jgi:micrococcal nuclease